MMSSGLYWMISMVLGGGVYLVALFIVKAFNSKEIEMVKSSVSFNQIKKNVFSSNNINV
jgi:hypothetical protein